MDDSQVSDLSNRWCHLFKGEDTKNRKFGACSKNENGSVFNSYA